MNVRVHVHAIIVVFFVTILIPSCNATVSCSQKQKFVQQAKCYSDQITNPLMKDTKPLNHTNYLSDKECAIVCYFDPLCVVYKYYSDSKRCLLGDFCSYLQFWKSCTDGEQYSMVENSRVQQGSSANCTNSDKILLYTIRSGSGVSARTTFLNPQGYTMPTDGTLPDVYRNNDVVDNLKNTIITQGKTEIVYSFYTNNNVVSQVVFDVATNQGSLTIDNWFSASRNKSSYPFSIVGESFNYFSIDGHTQHGQRRFFMSLSYGPSCGDFGFMVIIDATGDACQSWNTGPNLPTLTYNSVSKSAEFRNGAMFAERLIIYLQ